MIIKKKNLNLFFLFIFFLLFVLAKNYLFCDLFSDCSLTQDKYGGDLNKYFKNYYSGIIINYFSAILYLIFKIVHPIVNFETFLVLFQLTFYTVIFFSGIYFLQNNEFWKFLLFVLVILFYPFYDNYSSFLLKQGMGMIFLFISLFLVKKVFSFTSWVFILLAIFCHYIFLLFYSVFFIIRFFSLNFLIILFLISILIYIFGINNTWYLTNIEFLYDLNIFFVPENALTKINQETKLRFIVFSSLPLISIMVIQFRNIVLNNIFLKNLYKFHMLYSSITYLFFSEFYYIDRFLSITWIFYPFYFLALINIFKLNEKNSASKKIF